MNVNEAGTIYYGTDIKYIKELDKKGISKPRHRQEEFLSVSISGYTSAIEIGHPDLLEMAKVYSNHLKVCLLQENKMYFKSGYKNSMTCFQGFGPCPNKHLVTVYGLIENTRSRDKVVAVVSKKSSHKLVKPDASNEHEYLSLALHGFIKEILPIDIVGWIVHSSHLQEVSDMMRTGEISNKPMWTEVDFDMLEIDEINSYKYALFPDKIDMYLHNLEPSNAYYGLKTNHLKHIFSPIKDLVFSDMKDVKKEVRDWVEINKASLVWDDTRFIYTLDEGRS